LSLGFWVRPFVPEIVVQQMQRASQFPVNRQEKQAAIARHCTSWHILEESLESLEFAEW